VSRAAACKWWHRYVEEGDAGLFDRSSRPLHSPCRTPARVERQIEALRRHTKRGPVRIAVRLHMPASTVHRVLVRRQLNRLSWMDRPTGRVIRRYEHEHPGDLIHVDVKKLGRIPPGGGCVRVPGGPCRVLVDDEPSGRRSPWSARAQFVFTSRVKPDGPGR
jgi:hypothetical protein